MDPPESSQSQTSKRAKIAQLAPTPPTGPVFIDDGVADDEGFRTVKIMQSLDGKMYSPEELAVVLKGDARAIARWLRGHC